MTFHAAIELYLNPFDLTVDLTVVLTPVITVLIRVDLY